MAFYQGKICTHGGTWKWEGKFRDRSMGERHAGRKFQPKDEQRDNFI